MGGVCSNKIDNPPKPKQMQTSEDVEEINEDKPELSEFTKVRTIGTGSFSKVELVRLGDSIYALKAVSINQVCRLHQSTHVIQNWFDEY